MVILLEISLQEVLQWTSLQSKHSIPAKHCTIHRSLHKTNIAGRCYNQRVIRQSFINTQWVLCQFHSKQKCRIYPRVVAGYCSMLRFQIISQGAAPYLLSTKHTIFGKANRCKRRHAILGSPLECRDAGSRIMIKYHNGAVAVQQSASKADLKKKV